jgi:hypothetical protein
MCMGSIKPEVESHTLKFIVGVIAISLATVTNFSLSRRLRLSVPRLVLIIVKS